MQRGLTHRPKPCSQGAGKCCFGRRGHRFRSRPCENGAHRPGRQPAAPGGSLSFMLQGEGPGRSWGSGLEQPCCPAWPGAAGACATWTATDPRKWMSWLPSIPRKRSGEAWEETQHEGPCGCTAATPSPSLHQDQPSPRGDLGLSWELCTHRDPPAPHQQRYPEESRWSHTRQGGTLPS